MDNLQYYHEEAEIKHGADTRESDIDFQGRIIMGKYVDKEKPSYLEAIQNHYTNVIGDDYQLYGKTEPEREEEKKKAKAKPKATP